MNICFLKKKKMVCMGQIKQQRVFLVVGRDVCVGTKSELLFVGRKVKQLLENQTGILKQLRVDL